MLLHARIVVPNILPANVAPIMLLRMRLIRSVHHCQITIPPGGEEEARRFYGAVLGLAEVPKPDALAGRGGVWFEVDGFQLHLGVEEDRHTTRAHIAWEVEDLGAARKVIEQLGSEVYESAPIPGAARFESKDPFGNRIEFIKRTDE